MTYGRKHCDEIIAMIDSIIPPEPAQPVPVASLSDDAERGRNSLGGPGGGRSGLGAA